VGERRVIYYFGNESRFKDLISTFKFQNVEVVYVPNVDEMGIQVPRVLGIWVELGMFVDDSILSKFPNLKFVFTTTTGLSHIDQDAVRERNINLISLGNYPEITSKISSTAELTWLLVMCLTRKLSLNLIKEKMTFQEIARLREENYGRQLKNLNFGVVGYGRTGKQVSSYAAAFDMNIGWYDPYVLESSIANPRCQKIGKLEDLVSSSDILVLTASVNESNAGLLSRALLSRMRPSAIVINTARANLWDECAVTEYLTSGRIGGVGVDVYSFEERDYKNCDCLLGVDERNYNIVRTAHIGGATEDALKFSTIEFCKKIDEVVSVLGTFTGKHAP